MLFSLCAEAMPLKSKAFRRQRTARLAGEKCVEFELHRPSNKGTKLLLKVIKAIIIIIAALAENAINVSESVSVRVGVCVCVRVCV